MAPGAAAHFDLLIGTYTRGGEGGVHACGFDGASLTAARLVAQASNPSYLVTSSDERRLYTVNEESGPHGERIGHVSAFARDPRSGELALLGTRPSGGLGPCHLALDPTGGFVVVANYASGSVGVLPVEEDGRLGPPRAVVQHEGSSVHPLRQQSPHAHMVGFDPLTGHVLVSDLGLDALLAYRLEDDGRLEPLPGRRVALPAGSGPRHFAFHPGGDHLFVVGELDNTIVALARRDEGFVATGAASTLPAGATGTSYAAALRVSPSGRWVLATNRGEDGGSTAVLAFADRTGTLELMGCERAAGTTPRECLLSADGRHLLVASQDADVVELLAFEESSGSLAKVAETRVPAPSCLRLVPAAPGTAAR